jgi:hypothetical protein
MGMDGQILPIQPPLSAPKAPTDYRNGRCEKPWGVILLFLTITVMTVRSALRFYALGYPIWLVALSLPAGICTGILGLLLLFFS